MKEKPILFSSDMVRAILEGKKTQTRRVIKPQPNIVHALYPDATIETNLLFRSGKRIKCPYGQVGDRLWVRETWTTRKGLDKTKPIDISHEQSIAYIADEEGPYLGKIRPSIHMPRWASRITLEITEVRVERVQEISTQDIWKEGVTLTDYIRYDFQRLWDSINAKKGYGWDTNCWCWVVGFRRL